MMVHRSGSLNKNKKAKGYAEMCVPHYAEV